MLRTLSVRLLVAALCIGAPSVPARTASAVAESSASLGAAFGVRFRLERAASSAAKAAEPVGLAVADFDEDGVADVVTLSRSDGVSVLRTALSTGASREPATAPANASFVVAGDFDADGHADVAVAARGGRSLEVFSGDGAGRLATSRAVELPGPITALATGDVGLRDGLEDLLVGTSANGIPTVAVLVGPLGAARATARTVDVGAPVAALAAGDLDANGIVEVVVGAGSNVVTLEPVGRAADLDWSHPARRAVDVGAQVAALAAANFEGDGRLDVAYATDRAVGVAALDASDRLVARDVAATGGATRVAPLRLADARGYRTIGALAADGRLRLVDASGATAEIDADAAALAPLPIASGDALSELAVFGRDGSDARLVAATSENFVVTTTADSGEGSLRAAMDAANATPDADTISFAIPGAGPFTICPTSPLPTVLTPTIVDATTQPGYAGSPIVRVDGSCGAGVPFRLEAGGSTIRGLEIARFTDFAVLVEASDCVVEGNVIDGDDPTSGAVVRGGVFASGASDLRVGGTTSAARNVIFGRPINSDAAFYGVRVATADSLRAAVTGNYVGMDASGATARGTDGFGISGSGAGATVGGTQPGAANVVAGGLRAGILLGTDDAAGDLIQGNIVGLDASGSRAVGRLDDGMIVSGSNTVVGGTSPAARNVVSGIVGEAVYVSGNGHGIVVQGNVFGLDVSGQTTIPNAGAGVLVGASDNTIGGDVGAAGNLMRGGSTGVAVIGGTGNAILTNSIAGTAFIAIDLSPPGVNFNDRGDADEGVNRLQNSPDIESASVCDNVLSIRGVLDSTPSSTFRLQFFSNDACGADGAPWADVFLSETTVTTDVQGFAPFALELPAIPAGRLVVATATDAGRNTSELSPCVAVSAPEADLGVALARSEGAVRRGQSVVYTATVTNAGPEAACGATATVALPDGLEFVSATATRGTLTKPAVGATGDVVDTVGALASGESVTVVVTATVAADAPAAIVVTATVTGVAEDANAANDVATDTANVVADPVIVSAKPRSGDGLPFTVVMRVVNLQAGAVVYIGSDPAPWPNVETKAGRKLILKQGKTLRARFPKNVPVPVRVVNPDGGEATATVTR